MCELLCRAIMSHPMLLHRSVLYDHLQASEHTRFIKEHKPSHKSTWGMPTTAHYHQSTHKQWDIEISPPQ